MRPNSVAQRERRYRLIKEKRCSKCGGPNQTPWRRNCFKCQKKHRAYINEYMRGYRAGQAHTRGTEQTLNRKRRAIQLLGGACQDCGFKTDFLAVYDFDHREPSEKEFEVSRLCRTASWERIEKELAKCDLVCANCHRIRTSKRQLL